jgi:hypothetical protein
MPHVPEVQLPEPEVNLPPIAPAHTNTIGVQADNNVINGRVYGGNQSITFCVYMLD